MSRIAAIDANSELSYGDLEKRVDQLAGEMRLHGIRPGRLVAFRFPPGVRTVAAVLAILEVGAAYLPLDPAAPVERTRAVLGDARPCALLADDAETARSLGASPLGQVGGGSLVLAGFAAPAREIGEQTAYVIYTSGTTGKPKGVPITHENVSALFAAVTPWFRFRADDRWLLFHNIAFDFSVWELWGALLHGGCLVIPDRWTVRDPRRCAELIRAHGITVLNQTPTAFGQLLPHLMAGSRGLALRYLVFGGERLLPGFLHEFAATHDVAMFNMYGITETTVHATIHPVRARDIRENRSVVGRELPGFCAVLLGEDGLDATDGELWLAGPQVSSGYLDRPELTAERFRMRDGVRFYRSGDRLARNADGDLVYLGRLDDQVKIRGHRIELGDVERSLLAVPGVRAATAVVLTGPDGDELACGYASASGRPIPPRTWRARLRLLLPDYMIPRAFVHLDEIPRTANGKADRRAVLDLLQGRT